jgi:hemoglobin
VTENPTPYELFGGHEFFEKLVHSFYSKVPLDPILSKMYPEKDYAGAEWRLRSFLEQYWGGPETYSEQRGHPRLRMRHSGYHIDTAARNQWLLLMGQAVKEQGMPENLEAELWKYLVAAAYGMQNVPDETPENPTEIPLTEV